MCRVSSGTQDPSETQRKLGVWCPRGDSVPREKHRKAFPWKQEFSWVQEEHVGHCAVDLRLVVSHIFTIFRAKIEIYVFEMHVKYASTWFAHQLTKCDAYL